MDVKAMKKKFGWTALGMVGFIFAPIGLLFAGIPLVLWILLPNLIGAWDGSVLFLSIFGGVGTLFLILGLLFLSVDLRRRSRLRRAYEGGYFVEAEILGIRAQENVSVNHVHPYVLECAYTDPSGTVHVYRSQYLYQDVTPLLKSHTVPVYLDRYDDSVGFVDVDAVLPEIRVHG